MFLAPRALPAPRLVDTVDTDGYGYGTDGAGQEILLMWIREPSGEL